MSVIDDVLLANQAFAKDFHARDFTRRPRKQLVALTCMDTRLTIASLGLSVGDAHVIRNAGGIITEDSLRSFILSRYFLGTREAMIINHTDCGLMKMSDEEMRKQVVSESGAEAERPVTFHAFEDPEENVREQLRRFRAHPWLKESMPVRGFVYDVETGKLTEVVEPPAPS